MAPEVFCEGIYHPSCDLWSVGIILYECLFGNPPYASQDSNQLKAKLLAAEPIVIPSDVRISANCAALLRGLLKRNPEERINHAEFFEHPFVDVKHAPSSESLDKALGLLEEARKLEKKNDLKAAYECYTHGLAHLVSAVEYEANPHQKELLKQLASQYFTQAEGVKTRLKSGFHSNNAAPSRPPPPLVRGKNHFAPQTEAPISTVATTELRLHFPTSCAKDQPARPTVPPKSQCLSFVETKSADSTPSSPSSGILTYLKSFLITPQSFESDQPTALQAETHLSWKQAPEHPSSSKFSSPPLPMTQNPKRDQCDDFSSELAQSTEPSHDHNSNETDKGNELITNNRRTERDVLKQRFPFSSLLPDSSPHNASHLRERQQAHLVCCSSLSPTTDSPHVVSCADSRSSRSHRESASDGSPGTLPDVQLAQPERLGSPELAGHTSDFNPVEPSITAASLTTLDGHTEQQPFHTNGDSSVRRLQRVRALSMDLGSSQSTLTHGVHSDVSSTPSYAQQMALLADTARLFELKAMCSDSDTCCLQLIGWLEEFYSLLRTGQLSGAMKHLEDNFAKYLQVAKTDTNDTRRSAFLKELKLVLDLMESGKQQYQTAVLSEASSTAATLPEEVGVEATLEAETTNGSCCIS